MANILESYKVNGGPSILLVETSAPVRSQKWGRPAYLSLAVMAPGTEFKSVSSKDVTLVLGREKVDTRNKGPRSAYGKTVKEFRRIMAAEILKIGEAVN